MKIDTNFDLGCRAGAECPFIHDASAIQQNTSQSDQTSKLQTSADSSKSTDSSVATGLRNLSVGPDQPKENQASSHASQPQRPVSKIEQNDPREFQINQLRRRYRPEEKSDDKGSTLTFGLTPSDPDFPFELDSLQCVLYVPNSFPGTGRPTLAITNPEMESAYQQNISRGFDDAVDFTLRTNGRGTLLNWLNTLDRQLERLLTTLERGPKLTFVANIGSSSGSREPIPSEKVAPAPGKLPETRAPVQAPKPKPVAVQPKYTAEQRASAEKRRSMDTKQLEARLGRLPLFQKRSDNSFIIPIQPNKPDRLPRSLQSVKTVRLLIPHLYPLEHSSIEIQGVDSPEARSVETGFAQWFEKNFQMNLVSQINYLGSNMHNFAKTPLPEVAEQMQHEHIQEDEEETSHQVENEISAEPVGDRDRPHLHVIPRPPEWSVQEPHSGSDMTDESSYDEDDEDDEEGEETDGGAPVPVALDTPGRGVALSFPFLELYGIELLELIHLTVTIKCERCKDSMDIKNVPYLKDAKDTPKVESCKKCSNSMSIGR